MMPDNFKIPYQSSTIQVTRYGSGPQPVLCFHGYGEDASGFSFLEKTSEAYSFYCPDLPHHGGTNWREGNVNPAFFSFLIDAVLKHHMAQHEENALTYYGKISVLGFSLGSRMALVTLQYQPALINKIVLLAPDGLKVNFWYWLATQTYAGDHLFLWTMKNPGWFFNLLKMMKRTGVVNQSVYKFVQYYIDKPDDRMLLYQRWSSLSAIKPHLKNIRKLIAQHHIPCRLLYGKHDRIILPGRGTRFCKQAGPLCKVQIIEAGHQVLHSKHAADIILALKQ